MFVTTVEAADWPRWRGADGNGISSEPGWKSDWSEREPEVIWRGEVGVGFSSVVVSGGKVITTGNDGEGADTVYCLNAESGVELWKHRYEAPLDDKFYEGGPTSTPTIDGDVVYVLAKRGALKCLSSDDGSVVWEVNVAELAGVPLPGWGLGGSVVVEGDLLLVNGGKSGVGLNRKNGELVWKSEPEESGYSTPVVVGGEGRRTGIFSNGKGFSAVDVKTGEVSWSYRWVTRYGVNASDPIVDGSRVFISSGYGKGCVLLDVSGAEPREVWKSRVLRTQMNPCVLLAGHLYGTDGDEGGKAPLKCVELETGAEVWSEAGIGTGGVMIADGQLVVVSARGELIIAPASAAGFEPSLRMQVLGGKCWTVPVLANGLIYCRNAAGELACVDVRGK
ncbi:MAG: PQQ-like beta-propeller repeat protein [Verrucomicrobiales bacterium]|nr:PQQ-like beta-propeller repeat protein [Verrucomicrobiales bacterium]